MKSEENEDLTYEQMMKTVSGQSKVYLAMIGLLKLFSLWKKKEEKKVEEDQKTKEVLEKIRQQIKEK